MSVYSMTSFRVSDFSPHTFHRYNKPELVTALHRQLKAAGKASGPAE